MNRILPSIPLLTYEAMEKFHESLVIYVSWSHPIVEYALTVWDPNIIKDTDKLERVQRSATS